MTRTYILIVSIFVLSLSSCRNATDNNLEQDTNVLYLIYHNMKIGILPDIGGRLVFLSLNKGPNIIHSDSALWNEPKSEVPVPSAYSGWKEYNGHINWLGPQSAFWSQQNINKERMQNNAAWPPDPYLIYGSYSVIDQTDSSVILESPESPVSGIKFIKEYNIECKNTLSLKTFAVNIRDTTIKWDIWFNTRLNGHDRCYVPSSKEKIRLKHAENKNIQEVHYQIKSGYFTFIPQIPDEGYDKRSSKAFIFPDKPFITGFTENNMLFIEFPLHPPEKIHPEQALVEIYNNNSHDPSKDILELEYHSPYYCIPPGDSVHASEKWYVMEYFGPKDEQAHISFLEKEIPKILGL